MAVLQPVVRASQEAITREVEVELISRTKTHCKPDLMLYGEDEYSSSVVRLRHMGLYVLYALLRSSIPRPSGWRLLSLLVLLISRLYQNCYRTHRHPLPVKLVSQFSGLENNGAYSVQIEYCRDLLQPRKPFPHVPKKRLGT